MRTSCPKSYQVKATTGTDGMLIESAMPELSLTQSSPDTSSWLPTQRPPSKQPRLSLPHGPHAAVAGVDVDPRTSGTLAR